MGTSYTEYQGRGFWARDSQLEIWLHQLVLAVDRRPERPGWLREARDHWWLQATAGFMGCIGAALDDWLGDDPDRAAALAEVSREAERRLREEGLVRGDVLDAAGVGGPRMRWGSDLPADVVLPVAAAFLDLVTGRFDGANVWLGDRG